MGESFIRLSKHVEQKLDTVSVAFDGFSNLGGSFSRNALSGTQVMETGQSLQAASRAFVAPEESPGF
ncbi:MAG: hypothetical protein GC137_10250 [Alphaproteobacteria bacterium]|nr:hypothetical protein [Alphaproteobacteria bacterium]